MNRKIPMTLKWIFTVFMLILIPIYWRNYGPENFLWLSDITLFLTFLAVLLENRLFASMAAVGGLVVESFWAVSFFLGLFHVSFTDIAAYMYDSSLPIWLRLLSLFHLALPPLVIWLVIRLGYAPLALPLQIGVASAVVVVSWLVTNPAENINWVFSYKKMGLTIEPILYLVFECLLFAVIFGMTHFALLAISKRKKSNVGYSENLH